jgi:hypothetical protein
MATRKRVKVQGTSPADAGRPEKEADVETASDTITNVDVEHADNNAVPAVGSVEGPSAPTYRVDIESGGEADVGDVERGPA